MYWQGQYYDVNFIYKHDRTTGRLKEFAKRYPSLPENLSGSLEFPLKNKIRCSNSKGKGHRVHHCQIHHEQSTDQHYNRYKSLLGYIQMDPSDYLEIDLGEPRVITHIGTAGRHPCTKAFPQGFGIPQKKIKRWKCIENRGASSVEVLTYEPLCWVTSFAIWYNHPVLKKWNNLDEVRSNIDATSEFLLHLSPFFTQDDNLLTQYIRIQPKGFEHTPAMTVSVYGKPKELDRMGIRGIGGIWVAMEKRRAPTTSSDATIQTTDETVQSYDCSSDLPCIKYTVSLGCETNKVRDGLKPWGRHYKNDDNYPKNWKKKKRVDRKRETSSHLH